MMPEDFIRFPTNRPVMRNNRIEHLEEAPYATNDRAFYIYLDEATDGYTIENNWCPTERFDSNRPGNRNVWKNNGPQVTESIKNKAGRIKPGKYSPTLSLSQCRAVQKVGP